jgi:hypothetical protein
MVLGTAMVLGAIGPAGTFSLFYLGDRVRLFVFRILGPGKIK